MYVGGEIQNSTDSITLMKDLIGSVSNKYCRYLRACTTIEKFKTNELQSRKHKQLENFKLIATMDRELSELEQLVFKMHHEIVQ